MTLNTQIAGLLETQRTLASVRLLADPDSASSTDGAFTAELQAALAAASAAPGASGATSATATCCAPVGDQAVDLPSASPVAAPIIGAPAPAPTMAAGGYVLPTQSRDVIGTPYAGTHTLGNWESDNAVDLAAPIGTPVYAVASGVIGPQFGSLGAASGSRFAGLRLHLETAGNEFYYAHLSRFAPGIAPGSRVQAGQVIGYTGSANGVAHLHFGARSGNPLNLLGLQR